MADLKRKRVAELRKMAEKQKVEGWKDMGKNDLVEALSSSSDEEPDESDESDNTDDEDEDEEGDENPKPPTRPVRQAIKDGFKDGKGYLSPKAARTRAKIIKQPKVNVYIPLEDGEKKGTTRSVIINGWRVNIIKGVYVEVPRQVADILIQSQQAELEALQSPLEITGEGKSELD